MSEKEDVQVLAIEVVGKLMANPRNLGMTPQQLRDLAVWLFDVAAGREKGRSPPQAALEAFAAEILRRTISKP